MPASRSITTSSGSASERRSAPSASAMSLKRVARAEHPHVRGPGDELLDLLDAGRPVQRPRRVPVVARPVDTDVQALHAGSLTAARKALLGAAPRRFGARARKVPPRRPGWCAAGRAARRSPPPSTPAARAWTSALPSAAASTGPATTGSPQASAVSWQSRALRAPPPTTCTTSTSRPDSSAARAHGAPVGQRQAVEDAAHRLGLALRRRLPGRGCTPRRCGPACRRAAGSRGRRRPRPR